MVDTTQTFDCVVTGLTQVVGTGLIPSWVSVAQTGVEFIQVYISGVRTSSTSVSISESATVNSQTGVITVTISFSASSNVEFLELSYVVIQTSIFNIQNVNNAVSTGLYNWVGL
jgi:hypothetical protein